MNYHQAVRHCNSNLRAWQRRARLIEQGWSDADATMYAAWITPGR